MSAIKKAAQIVKAGDLVVLSDSNVDTAGDVVDQGGWVLDDFLANPVMFYGHSWDVPIGTWSDVRVEGGKLVGRPVFADVEGHTQAQLIKRLWDADVLKTVSVSFMPIDGEPIKGGGMHYHSQKLLEVSIVPIPANSNAHKLAMKALGLTEKAADDKLASMLGEIIGQLEVLYSLIGEGSDDEPMPEEEPMEESKGMAEVLAELNGIKERLDRLEVKPEANEATKSEQTAGPQAQTDEPKADTSINITIGE